MSFAKWAVAVLVVAVALPAWSQDKTSPNDVKVNQQKIAEMRRAMAAEVQVDDLQEPMSFVNFLELLSTRSVPMQIDAEAFGEGLMDLLRTHVKMPAFPKRIQALTAVRLALQQLPHDMALDYRCLPTHFALTSPDRAAYRKTYDVGEVIKSKPFLPEVAGRDFGWGESGSKHPAAFFVESISPSILRGPIQIINESRVIVHANDAGHAGIESIIDGYRRLADVGVLMNARLLEVSGDFYDRELHPLFGKGKAKGKVVKIADELAAALKDEKVVVEDERSKVRHQEKVRCLSLHTVWHALPKENVDGLGVYGTYLEGVTLFAQPEVTPDHRGLRLKVLQESTRVIEVRKKKIFDLTIENEIEVSFPELKETKLAATIDIADLQHLIMEVEYRPFPAPAGKRWLLWLQPRIYIEAEEEAIRKGMLESLPMK